jgi:CysZ protein
MHFFLLGLKVLLSSGYRKFILIPLVANAILFVVIAMSLFSLLPSSVQWLISWIPDWLPFMEFFIYSFASMIFLFIYGMSFSIITNVFAAPFNGFLAEKIQREAGLIIPEESISSVIIRTLARELKKLMYFIGYGILVAILLFFLAMIPVVNLLVPVLAFLWLCWCLAIQYLDYAADNTQQSFVGLRKQAKKPFISTFGFGAIVAFLLMVPIVNIFVMPAAVAGGTLMWIKKIHMPNADFNADDFFDEPVGGVTHPENPIPEKQK